MTEFLKNRQSQLEQAKVGPKRVAAGRVEQVTAIRRFNIMEFRTGLFFGDRYRQVTVI